jgi:hypothetical protein
MLAAFLVTLAVYLYQKNKFALLSVVFVLIMFTDYVPVFMLPVFLIHALVIKKNIKKTIYSYLPLVVVGLFWLPIFNSQLETGNKIVEYLPAWRDLAGGATIKNAILFWSKMILGRISFYPKHLYYLLVLIASSVFVYPLVKSIKRENLLYWLWFIVPLLLGFVFSFIFPVFNYFRFIYVIPAFYVLVSQINIKTLIALMVAVNLTGCGIYLFDKNQHRENWKQAVRFAENSLAENEAVVLNYPEPFAPYRWYTDNYSSVLTVSDTISVAKHPVTTANKVERSIQNLTGLYYFNYLESLTDPNKVVRNKIGEMGFKTRKTYTFNGVGEVEYLVK